VNARKKNRREIKLLRNQTELDHNSKTKNKMLVRQQPELQNPEQVGAEKRRQTKIATDRTLVSLPTHEHEAIDPASTPSKRPDAKRKNPPATQHVTREIDRTLAMHPLTTDPNLLLRKSATKLIGVGEDRTHVTC
jgi:hypothetical protein